MTTVRVKKGKKAKRLAPTPRLRRGQHSAFDVLMFVADRVEQEPKRLRMWTWITMLKGKPVGTAVVLDKPACGTVACIGGWINVVTRNTPSYDPGVSAIRKLGLNTHPMDWGSHTHALELSDIRIQLTDLFRKVRWRSTRAVKELRRIATRHEAKLKSLTVEVQ